MSILRGYINLSKIDKSKITTNKNEEKILWVDLLISDTPDKYGNTGALSVYDKETKGRTYIANFKPKEENYRPSTPKRTEEDLPF